MSTRLIYEDLSRQDITGMTFDLGTEIDVPGLGQTEVPIVVRQGNSLRMVIALSEPLCSNMLCQRELSSIRISSAARKISSLSLVTSPITLPAKPEPGKLILRDSKIPFK